MALKLIGPHTYPLGSDLSSGYLALSNEYTTGTEIRDLPCQWNLDSGFQLLAGFRIPRAEFWSAPKPRIPGFTIQLIRLTIMGRREEIEIGKVIGLTHCFRFD